MKRYFFAPGLMALMFLVGCASAPKFQSVDLNRDLDAAALARYKTELAGATEGDCCGRLLEKTDGRILGSLIYWHGGAVRGTENEGYMISETYGFGPLAGLWVQQTMANYGADGKRQGTMKSANILWGHLGMIHSMDTQVGPNEWHTHWMAHLVHHLLGISIMNGKTTLSLFSMPNPLMIGE